jgi:hypothetical protein
MNVNVPNLQDAIKKATLNYLIETVQLHIDGATITSKMRSQNNDVVVVLNQQNNVLSDVPDAVDFNFDKPNTKVKPYLNLIDNELVQAQVSDEKILLKDGRHKTNLHFCMPSFVTAFTGAEPQAPVFYELDITEEVFSIFKKIMKVGGTFEKVYFAVRDKELIIETTDRGNRFANGISFVVDSVDQANLDICVSFQNFVGVYQCIGGREDFKVKLVWMADQEAGMVIFEKADQSERYYLLHKLEH